MPTVESLKSKSLFLDVGTFADYGGWVLDTQFIPTMGSAYLLAHGLGTPVSDATTSVAFPEAGRYRVWVRTKNWVADWKPQFAPGLFRRLVVK